MKRSRASATFILLAVALAIALSACSRTETTNQTPPPAAAEQAPPATHIETGNTETPVAESDVAATTEPPAPDLTPPQPDEARRAVARVYAGALKIDEQSGDRAIVGDFNSDGSADIAIVVRPSAAQLEELNSEFANWIVEDPHAVVVPDSSKTVHRLPATEEQVRIEADDILLAIIHGHAESGWRNPAARQSYLLKNAVGSRMKSQPLKEARNALPQLKKVPRLQGDVIAETLGDHTGLLYWTGAKYAWIH